MPTFHPEALARWTGGRWSPAAGAYPTGFCADSRRIAPGDAFVALKTEKRDGHDFLGEALKAGAAAAIVSVENPAVALPQLVVRDPLAALQSIARENRRRFSGPVIGITGSAGKTSTKEMVALLLGSPDGGVLATQGNLNNHIGVALTLVRLDPALHRFAVVEAGISGPGEMDVLSAMIEPDVAVVTMVGPAHLEELGGLEGVAREKAALFASLRPAGACVFPESCEVYAAFRRVPGRRVVAEPAATLQVRVPEGRSLYLVNQSPASTRVSVAFGQGPALTVGLARVSDGMARNVALAVTAALLVGAKASEVAGRLDGWAAAPLRGEWRTWQGRRVYLDCYNANPASMSDALAAFVAMAPAGEPRTYVIGCMEELGSSSRQYHTELGRSLPLGPGDRALVVGAMAEVVRRAAVLAGFPEGQVAVTEPGAPLAAALGEGTGPVFVKGSRRYELEKVFSANGVGEVAHA